MDSSHECTVEKTRCEFSPQIGNLKSTSNLTELPSQLIDAGPAIQTVVQGLLYGSIYALSALGLSMIFSVLGVLNLVHGDFVMLGGFVGLLIAGEVSVSQFGLIAIFVIFVGAFVLIALLGAAFEFALIRPTLKRGPDQILISSILITVGAAFVIEDLGYIYMPSYIIGRQNIFTIPLNLNQFKLVFGGINLNGVYLIALVSIAAATIFLYLFSRGTYLGRAMRAITQNPESTRLMGVNLQRVSILTFAIGSGFAGLAGVSIGMANTLSPGFGLAYTISLLSVMVLGGTRSYWGPLVGGLIIGFVQVLVGAPFLNPISIPFTSYQIQNLAYWAPAAAIVILIIALMVRPTGLAGRSQSTRA
jgi:branched-chain amino acid transport system permease protein